MEYAALAVVALVAVVEMGWVWHQVNHRGPQRSRQLIREALADSTATAPLVETMRTSLASAAAPSSGTDLVRQRWAKQAERDRVKAAIYAWMAERVGPVGARAGLALVPKDVLDGAIRLGDQWAYVLEPIMERIVATSDAVQTTTQPTQTHTPAESY